MTENGPERGYALFEWIGRHVWPIAAVMLVIAVALASFGLAVADDTEPSFAPTGEIYTTQDRVEDVFESSSPVRGAVFIAEAASGDDVLTRDALLELKRNQEALRTDRASQQYLMTAFSRDLGIEIDGVYSVADAVDEHLPGGLEAATDADVKLALADLLADDSPMSALRFLLSTTSTEREPTTIDGQTVVVWKSSAFFVNVRYNIDEFPEPETEDGPNLDAESWLRDAQTLLRGDQESVKVIGVAIDEGLSFQEQSEEAAPYILGAVAFILIFVGALLRSYWAAMVVGAGLGIVMMGFNGINGLIGLKTGSPLLIMIVPIALISFGVDFFIHGSGRAREAQVEGHTRERAYPVGETAVFAALLLAALSSAAAFLSNTVSGIEAIIQFGIASAIGLLLCYVVLGLVGPKLLLAVEDGLGPRPANISHTRTVGHKLGFLFACVIGGVAVAMAIAAPVVGIPIYLVLFLFLTFYLPYRITRRRNRRAAEAGSPLTDEVKGAGHGFRAAGTIVHFLARWRVLTIPAVVVLAFFGLWGASKVEQGFELKDFFASDVDFVVSLDKLEQYYGSGGGDIDYVFVEGDLTSPATLLAMEASQAEIAASDAEFTRDFNGEIEFEPNAVEVVNIATASEPMRTAIATRTGIEITDADNDGFPDDSEQVAAIYAHVKANSVVNDAGLEVFRPDQIESFLYVGDGTQATLIAATIATFTDEVIIKDAQAVLEDAAAGLEEALGTENISAAVSGGRITQQDTLDSFMAAMLQSLPVAVILTSLLVFVALFFVFRHFGRRLASILKRSGRYAVVSMVPILLVVAWVYGFMYLVDYKINVITATIAAIAIGVGVDYATHFTMRFIEEFEHEPSRFPALRRAGEGTGGALAISAATSITGFLVMALAPMPMFQTFGILTAVMIALSLLVSLLVLPSLLLLITPSRKGAEREDLIAEVTQGGEFEYEPHKRETALRGGTDPRA